MTVVRSGSATDVGRIRQINQDMVLETPTLFAVADGMGGHAAGDVAARVAVEALHEAFTRDPSTEGLNRAVMAANEAVWRESHQQDELRGMGTTITAAALVPGPEGGDLMALVNVGDSRAYLFSAGEISQVTLDHSLAEERVRQGQLTEAQAAVDPRRHILTRALGVSSGVDVDTWELHLRAGDRLLLCSDGLSNEVADAQLARVLATVADPAEAAARLVQAANEHGGNDNITALVIDVVTGAEEDGAATVVPAAAGAAAAVDGSPTPFPAAPGTDAGVTSAVPAVGPAGEPEGRTTVRPMEGTAAAILGARATDAWPAEVAAPPPPPALPQKKETRRERRRRLGIPRRITFRVVLFFAVLVGVFVGAYYGLRYYANDNWFVTIKGNQLVVYRGQPGGVLWFNPRLVDRTGVTTAEIPAITKPTLAAGVNEASLAAAKGYVTTLVREHRQQVLASQPPPSTTTTGGVGPSGTIGGAPTTGYQAPAPTTGVPAPTTTTTVSPTAATVPPPTFEPAPAADTEEQ